MRNMLYTLSYLYILPAEDIHYCTRVIPLAPKEMMIRRLQMRTNAIYDSQTPRAVERQ